MALGESLDFLSSPDAAVKINSFGNHLWMPAGAGSELVAIGTRESKAPPPWEFMGRRGGRTSQERGGGTRGFEDRLGEVGL